MPVHTFLIGTDGGLAIQRDDLIARLSSEAGRDVSQAERDEAIEHLDAVLLASATSSSGGLGLSRRIGDGRYLAVGDLSRLGFAVLLGPVAHLLAAGTALSSAKRLVTFDRSWRPRIVAIYARLDGLEQKVFEAVHALQNEWLVANYDALADRNFAHAYARVAPSLARVSDAVGVGNRTEEIADALNALVARRILATDGDCYWIRF